MNDLKPVNCIHCHTLLRGKYCYECGQKFITQEDKKIKHFVLTFFSSMFFADGKLFKTVKTVLTKPGELTYTYISGDRRKYLAPLQMFFFANLLYFLFPVLSTFNTSLSTQMKHLPYSKYVKEVVVNHIHENNLEYEQYREDYELASAQNGKLLLVVLVLLQAAIFKLLFLKSKKLYFSDFIAASAYFNAIYIILLLIIVPSIILGLDYIFEFNLDFLDDAWLSLIFLLFIVVYLVAFIKRAFQLSTQKSALKSFLLAICLIPSFIIYRFILFWVSFWMV